MGMDKNTVIGFVLIFLLLLVWQQFNAPTPEQLELEKRLQDSIALVQQNQPDAKLEEAAAETQLPGIDPLINASDSVKTAQLGGTFGAFAAAAAGNLHFFLGTG